MTPHGAMQPCDRRAASRQRWLGKTLWYHTMRTLSQCAPYLIGHLQGGV